MIPKRHKKMIRLLGEYIAGMVDQGKLPKNTEFTSELNGPHTVEGHPVFIAKVCNGDHYYTWLFFDETNQTWYDIGDDLRHKPR